MVQCLHLAPGSMDNLDTTHAEMNFILDSLQSSWVQRLSRLHVEGTSLYSPHLFYVSSITDTYVANAYVCGKCSGNQVCQNWVMTCVGWARCGPDVKSQKWAKENSGGVGQIWARLSLLFGLWWVFFTVQTVNNTHARNMFPRYLHETYFGMKRYLSDQLTR